jgi:hypothetical protein
VPREVTVRTPVLEAAMLIGLDPTHIQLPGKDSSLALESAVINNVFVAPAR